MRFYPVPQYALWNLYNTACRSFVRTRPGKRVGTPHYEDPRHRIFMHVSVEHLSCRPVTFLNDLTSIHGSGTDCRHTTGKYVEHVMYQQLWDSPFESQKTLTLCLTFLVVARSLSVMTPWSRPGHLHPKPSSLNTHVSIRFQAFRLNVTRKDTRV